MFLPLALVIVNPFTVRSLSELAELIAAIAVAMAVSNWFCSVATMTVNVWVDLTPSTSKVNDTSSPSATLVTPAISIMAELSDAYAFTPFRSLSASAMSFADLVASPPLSAILTV